MVSISDQAYISYKTMEKIMLHLITEMEKRHDDPTFQWWIEKTEKDITTLRESIQIMQSWVNRVQYNGISYYEPEFREMYQNSHVSECRYCGLIDPSVNSDSDYLCKYCIDYIQR